MMEKFTHASRYALSVVVAAFLLFSSHWVNASTAGHVIMVKGTAIAKTPDGKERALERRSTINTTDTIITGPDSRIQIRFIDNALLALQENTQLHIHEYRLAQTNQADEKVLMELVEGGFRTLTGTIGKGNKDAYAVNTPVASIGVRGTLYSAYFKVGTLSVGVWQGGIAIGSPQSPTVELGRDRQFSYGTFANHTFTGTLTPPANLDASNNERQTPSNLGASNHLPGITGFDELIPALPAPADLIKTNNNDIDIAYLTGLTDIYTYQVNSNFSLSFDNQYTSISGVDSFGNNLNSLSGGFNYDASGNTLEMEIQFIYGDQTNGTTWEITNFTINDAFSPNSSIISLSNMESYMSMHIYANDALVEGNMDTTGGDMNFVLSHQEQAISVHSFTGEANGEAVWATGITHWGIPSR